MNSDDLNIKGDDVYYKVSMSPDFAKGNLVGCVQVDDYVLGSLIEREVVSHKELLEMKASYDNDYDNFKREMGVPDAFDFAIVSDVVTMDKLDSGDTFANYYVKEVLYENGTVENVGFILKVW